MCCCYDERRHERAADALVAGRRAHAAAIEAALGLCASMAGALVALLMMVVVRPVRACTGCLVPPVRPPPAAEDEEPRGTPSSDEHRPAEYLVASQTRSAGPPHQDAAAKGQVEMHYDL